MHLSKKEGVNLRRLSSEIASSDNGPFPKIRSLLCLTQCNLPLDAGVLFSAPQNGVGDFKVVSFMALTCCFPCE